MKFAWHGAWWIAALLLGIAGAVTRIGGAAPDTLQHLALPVLGPEVGALVCSPVPTPEVSYHDPNVNLAGTWLCQEHDKARIEVYLGYLHHATDEARLLSPVTNYPYSPGDTEGKRGWDYERKERVEIPLESVEPSTLPATVLLLKHDSGRQMVVTYWYHLHGSPLPDEFQYRLALMLRKVMRQSSAAAIVRLASWATEHDASAQRASQRALAAALYPRIKQALP